MEMENVYMAEMWQILKICNEMCGKGFYEQIERNRLYQLCVGFYFQKLLADLQFCDFNKTAKYFYFMKYTFHLHSK